MSNQILQFMPQLKVMHMEQLVYHSREVGHDLPKVHLTMMQKYGEKNQYHQKRIDTIREVSLNLPKVLITTEGTGFLNCLKYHLMCNQILQFMSQLKVLHIQQLVHHSREVGHDLLKVSMTTEGTGNLNCLKYHLMCKQILQFLPQRSVTFSKKS